MDVCVFCDVLYCADREIAFLINKRALHNGVKSYKDDVKKKRESFIKIGILNLTVNLDRVNDLKKKECKMVRILKG